MKLKVCIMAVLAAAIAAPVHADNIAGCEVVLMEPVLEDGKPTGAEMASFRPAASFLSSVYDDEDGFVDVLDGFEIRGIMCERRSLIPTLRDFQIAATGLPLAMSENFDSSESNLMTVFYKDGRFQHTYDGAPLSVSEELRLTDVMEVFNLQPHDLDKMEKISKEKHEEMK